MKSITRIQCLCFMVLVLLCLSLSQEVKARIFINIDSPSGNKLPVAITSLKNLDPETPLPSEFRDFQKILARDLKMAGLFRIISQDSFLESKNAGITTRETDFSLWQKSGADALIKGGIEYKFNRYSLELRLFDVQQQLSILGKRYHFPKEDFEKVVHTFADQIILKLTGESGVFASTKILCERTLQGRAGKKEIVAMNVDGKGMDDITKHNAISLSGAWSRDGRYIAYTSYVSGNPDLYLYDRKSERERMLSNRQGLNLGVAFSPIRNQVALAISNGSDTEIMTLNYRGSIEKRLTDNWWIDIEPSWAPNGKQLAFVSNHSGKPHVYRMNADGKGVKRLTFKGYHNVSPAWSPRGDKIAFAGKDKGYFDIFIMNTDGTHIQRLTSGDRNNESPSWAPNGQMIVFASDRSGKSQLYVMGADGSGQTRITNGKDHYTNPAWSPWLRD